MCSFDFSFLSIFIVFGHLTESRVVVLRDYEDEPAFLRTADPRASPDDSAQLERAVIDLSSNSKPPKSRHSKKSVLHYGRHIYHLDDFIDNEMPRRDYKPEPVAYNYVDLYHLIRSSAISKGGRDNLKNVVIFSETPIHICNGEQCDGDLRKFSSLNRHGSSAKQRSSMFEGLLKRFKIVGNNQKPESEERDECDSSEGYYQSMESRRKKRYNDFSGSIECEESRSVERHSRKRKKKKQTRERYSSSKSSEEVTRKPKRNHKSDFDSASVEELGNSGDEDSRSEEEHHKKRNKRRHKSSALKKHNKDEDDSFFLQGSKIFFIRDEEDTDSVSVERRRFEPAHIRPDVTVKRTETKHDVSITRSVIKPGKIKQDVFVTRSDKEPSKMGPGVSIKRSVKKPDEFKPHVFVTRNATEPGEIKQNGSVTRNETQPGNRTQDVSVTRRRLDPFLPKRYHWDPEDIHELGYFWFNGPKGLYPAPQRLPPVYGKK